MIFNQSFRPYSHTTATDPFTLYSYYLTQMGHGFDLHQLAHITRPSILSSSHSLSPSTALISNSVTSTATTNRIGWDPETNKTTRKEQCRFAIFYKILAFSKFKNYFKLTIFQIKYCQFSFFLKFTKLVFNILTKKENSFPIWGIKFF